MDNADKQDLRTELQRRLRWITLAVILVTAITQYFIQPLLSQFVAVREMWTSVAFLTALAISTGLIDCFKVKPSWRVLLILCEVGLIAAAGNFSAYKFYYFLYMCVVAKAALYLTPRLLSLIIGASFAGHLVDSSAKLGLFYDHIARASHGVLPARVPFLAWEGHIFFLFSMVIVAAMVRTMVSERENRLKTERLSDEIEQLVIKSERSRISRDIHDSLGHTLTSLNIQLDIVKSTFDSKPAVARDALTTAQDLAATSLADVRRSVHMIREAEDSSFNLTEALSGLITRAKRNHDLEIELSIDQPELPLLKSYNLFCIAQEALTNAQRHAHAKKIQIELQQDTDQLSMSIIDDGQGFDTMSSTKGLGMKSMGERIEGIGGTLRIDSTPGSGTRVNVLVPLT